MTGTDKKGYLRPSELSELPDVPNPKAEGWEIRKVGDRIAAGTQVALCWKSRGTWLFETLTEDRIIERHHATHLTPPAPKPWDGISTDREKPTDAYVNGVPGRYFLHPRGVCAIGPSGDTLGRVCNREDVTAVEPLHTGNPETHVPVERALIDEAAAWADDHPFADHVKILNALAALADEAES